MQIRELLTDDDAVSPVIGVILMVAITVILADVIATFVLGLGDSVSDTAPQASISTDFTTVGSTDGNLEFQHDGGDTITATELIVRGQNGSNADDSGSYSWNDNWKELADGKDIGGCSSACTDGSSSATKGGQSAVVGGDYLQIPIGDDGEVDLVWEPGSGDQSATLTEWSGPAA